MRLVSLNFKIIIVISNIFLALLYTLYLAAAYLDITIFITLFFSF